MPQVASHRAPRWRWPTSTATAGRISTSPTAPRTRHNRLYRNNGDGRFTDVAAQLGVAEVNRTGTGVSMGAVWGDYDNDGYEDLLVYKYGRPLLFHNDGGKGFTDVSASAPACRRGSTPTAPRGSTSIATAGSISSSPATGPTASTCGGSRPRGSCRRASSTPTTAAASTCCATRATARSRTSPRRWASRAAAGRWPWRPRICAAPAIPTSSSPTTTACRSSTPTRAGSASWTSPRPPASAARRRAA